MRCGKLGCDELGCDNLRNTCETDRPLSRPRSRVAPRLHRPAELECCIERQTSEEWREHRCELRPVTESLVGRGGVRKGGGGDLVPDAREQRELGLAPVAERAEHREHGARGVPVVEIQLVTLRHEHVPVVLVLGLGTREREAGGFAVPLRCAWQLKGRRAPERAEERMAVGAPGDAVAEAHTAVLQPEMQLGRLAGGERVETRIVIS